MAKLHVNDGGTNGIPVVFLHSLGGRAEQWQAQLDHMRQTRRAIAVDLRGHGLSATEGSYTLTEMAHDVAETIADLGVEQIILVGHSMGGAVANKFVGLYPERVVGLVLADVAGDSTQIPEEALQGLLAALASPAYDAVVREYWDEILVDSAESTQQTVLSQLTQTPKSTIVGIFNELVRFNPLPDLACHDGAKLIISTPHSDAPFSLSNLRPDIPHIRMEGTSHWLHMDNSAEFNRHLDHFIAAL